MTAHTAMQISPPYEKKTKLKSPVRMYSPTDNIWQPIAIHCLYNRSSCICSTNSSQLCIWRNHDISMFGRSTAVVCLSFLVQYLSSSLHVAEMPAALMILFRLETCSWWTLYKINSWFT